MDASRSAVERAREVMVGSGALVIMSAWTVVIGGSLAWNVHQERDEARQSAVIEARSVFSKDLATRRWASSHGGVYVPVTARTPPNPYLGHVPDRDITLRSGQALTLMNPAYMLRQMMEDYGEGSGIRGRITSLKPLNPINTPDPWEREALQAFERGSREAFAFVDIQARPYVRLMQPMVTTKDCLKCHAAQGYAEGDIRGGIGVTVPIAQYLEISSGMVRTLSVFHALVWAAGIGGVGLFFSRATKNRIARERLEEVQRRNLDMLAHVIDSVPQSIFWKDRDGVYLGCNETFARAAGLARADEVVGKTDLDFPWRAKAEAYRVESLEVIASNQPQRHMVEQRQHADGSILWVDTTKIPLTDREGRVYCVLGVYDDITERKIADEAIRTALEEKTALLREVQHRVKNNLQIVSSLLSLRAAKAASEQERQGLIDTQTRVRSMALLHETLSRSANLARIDFSGYVESLCAHMFRATTTSTAHIRLTTRVEGVSLGLDQAIPCGLIITELVSNAMKHAFGDGRRGEITVELTADADGQVTLTVADDGAGIPAALPLPQTSSLGLQLVYDLAQQLHGTVEIQRAPGTTCRVVFTASTKSALDVSRTAS